MEKEGKKDVPDDVKSFMKWAMEKKLTVSPRSWRKITKHVNLLYKDGLITEANYKKYYGLTKAWARKQ